MRIAVIGAGYVGLVSGACFADFGHTVTCIDSDADKVSKLRSGEIPIFEPGLDELVSRNVASGSLEFTTELETAIPEADVVFLAVGTPSRRGDGQADLSYVHAAAKAVAEHITGYTVIVTKSTVPVGTGDVIERIIREANSQADFSVASNPEFLREGAAIEDFKRPDRIVVGTEEERARTVMREVYRPLSLNEPPIQFTTRRTSELIKYASNAFLAMKITFINEMADLCEAVGADVQEIARGIGTDKRIGPKFLNAGPGYGGSCFPKDTLALIKTAQDFGSPVRLIETTVSVNDHRKRSMARKIIVACGGNLNGKRICILGLTFKPNTDDMRDAPSLTVIPILQDAGARISAFDPEGMDAAQPHFTDIKYHKSPYEAAEGADALVILTEWDSFRALDLRRIGASMTRKILVDLRNIYRPKDIKQLGFAYTSVGRPSDLEPAERDIDASTKSGV